MERDLSHAYDRGYWDRVDGKARPTRNGDKRRGWDTADAELKDENENLTHEAQRAARPRTFRGD